MIANVQQEDEGVHRCTGGYRRYHLQVASKGLCVYMNSLMLQIKSKQNCFDLSWLNSLFLSEI